MQRSIQLAVTILLAGAALLGCRSEPPAAEAPKFPCLNPPSMSADIPGDTVLSDQQSFNCFAWQEFIALNWPTDPGATAGSFGDPGVTAPVVWETYMNVHDLLDADGTAPPPWGETRPAPEAAGEGGARIFSRTAKLGQNFDPSKDINEAAPHVAWLADTGGNLVWYEILVNKAEYDYFVQTGFYDSETQYRAAASGTKIDLPMGTVGGGTGAMEIKAAWLSVPDPDAERWRRYKLSEGTFCTGVGTSDEHCDTGTIALVGLHILHKTTSQPSWTWATFEHIDNAPDARIVADELSPASEYSFYSAECTPQPVPPGCLEKDKKGREDETEPPMTSCTPNTPPAYALGPFIGKRVDPSNPCQPYPIQVVREFPIPDTNEDPVVSTNTAAQAVIAAANPDSVFQYYQLVNVLWSDSPVNENAGSRVPHAPLSKTAFRPNLTAFPVANTVLETYAQSISCLECHSGAGIAKTVPGADWQFASDYSFVFGMAGPKSSSE